ncbi:DUF2339 domain-containing protein [Ulvibacterium marinum]|uniref:DUF2339 domain-containing protein n=1 Tax=Ulvibacterium marinum TaxID=2419782 RepID=A0A3B0C3C0_9FLAO|nr:DUF2339 domain-containing protein [Ulvibacterium marinum]RKN79710.1 DUF2339 domain-containing protein [Ulvibacterium marinum]
MDNKDKIEHLRSELEKLLKRQNDISEDINSLRVEIDKLHNSETRQEDKALPRDYMTGVKPNQDLSSPKKEIESGLLGRTTPEVNESQKIQSNLEKFIGENLINKIGIAVTVIGIALGAKYSIEHDLVSPLVRIILGYLSGIVLLGFGFKLRKTYKNYSAVLVSGAISILYFITYFAYNSYGLFPQMTAFLLMVIFTIFSVFVAINYNKQVIAHIGLVGGYAVPFLLNEGSGEAVTLFSYITIINTGILIISFKKYWKSLFYSSFGFTWLIFFLWYLSRYRVDEHFGQSLIFLCIFFITFYLTFLTYKLIKKEEFRIENIILLLLNSFIFYGIGYAILGDHQVGQQLLGVFTICNAIIHFLVSILIYRQRIIDRNISYFVSGIALVFVSITIPIQLDGNWVTLLWAGEAALLFWIGRRNSTYIYEKLSYFLMFLAFFSNLQDWATMYGTYKAESTNLRIKPLLNINFLSSLLVSAAFGFINLVNRSKKYSSYLNPQRRLSKIISFSIPAFFLFTLYGAFHLEIANFWDQQFVDSTITIGEEDVQYHGLYKNHDLLRFKTIWLINYTLFFVSTLSFLNIRKLKERSLGTVNLCLIVLSVVIFLTLGLHALSELRISYLEQTLSQYYQRGIGNISLRYISLAFVALALFMSHKYIGQDFLKRNFRIPFDFFLHTSILWVLSSELINWTDIMESTQYQKLGLSILWGSYSFWLIVLGIWKKKKYLRIGAITLFAATLLKLFIYDISHLDTFKKAIVFVLLGILLLISSFLYNKYKHIISETKKN